MSGEDKRGRERNSNDSIGQKSEHSNTEEVNRPMASRAAIDLVRAQHLFSY